MRFTALLLLFLATVSEGSRIRGARVERELKKEDSDEGGNPNIGCDQLPKGNPFNIPCTLLVVDPEDRDDGPCVTVPGCNCGAVPCFGIPAYGPPRYVPRCGPTKQVVADTENLSVDVVKAACVDIR